MANKKKWIKGAIKRPGAFTKKAKDRGLDVGAFVKKVLANPNKYDKLTVQQANLAKTLRSMQGGGQYALPTSAAATTSNMMGMGDPAQLQKNLELANSVATEQQQRMKAQEEMRTKAAGQASKDNLESAYTRSQERIASTFPGIGTTAVNTARVGMGTANAAQVAQASGDSTATLLGNLGNYGTQTTGQAARAGLKAGLKSAGPNALASVGGTGIGLAGAGVKHLSNDNDATTMNFGETAGTLMQGAGTGLSLAGTLGLMGAVPGIGWAAAGLGALGYGAHALIQKKKAKEEQEKIDEQNALARQQTSRAQSEAFNNAFTKTGADLGYNVGNSLTNSYTPSQQIMYKDGGQLGDPHKRMLRKQNRETRRAQKAYERASKKANRKGISPYKEGGEMIKRADGSYSPRGLWDNIRANKGSGKKPTKQMLEQERKIKAEEKKKGGYMKALPGNAVEFVGPKHKDGGIMLDPQTEVEGGETMDKVNMSANKASDYIFSDYLKLGGKTFAKRHKEILKRGGGEAKVQAEIQRLAKMQEEVARRNGEKDRSPDKVMRNGGVKKYQTGDTPFAPVNQNFADFMNYQSYLQNLSSENPMSGAVTPADKNDPNYGLAPEAAYAVPYPGRQPETAEGLYELPGSTGEDRVTMSDYERQRAANPWFDWGENFNPANPSDVDRLQNAFAEQIKGFEEYDYGDGWTRHTPRLDDMYGVETSSLGIPYKQKAVTAPETPKGCPCDDGTYSDACCEKEVEKTGCPCDDGTFSPSCCEKTPEIPPGGKKPPKDFGWMAALPGLLQLGKNDPYPQARTIGAEANRMVNLPRVNFNAERAANQATNIGTKRMFANQAAGPGGMAAALAADAGARSQNIQIANQEARTNKDLMAQEASINANIGQQNAARAQQAAQYNAANLQQMDVNRHEQNIYNRQHRADVMTGVARDIMAYKSDERLANAISDSGAYERLTAQERARLRGLVGDKEEKQTAKKGGYIKRSNKIRRKRRK